MKKFQILLLVLLFCSTVFSQNTFEKRFYTADDSEFRFVKETSNGDFILSANASSKSDYIVKLSANGDSLGVLNYSIPEGNMYFFGLFDHPQYDDMYISPAVVSNNGIRNKIALLTFDIGLAVADIKVISFEDHNINFSNRQIPIPVINNNDIVFASLVELPSGNYAHLFANIDINGNLNKYHIDESPDYSSRSYPSDFSIINDNPIQYSCCYFKVYYADGINTTRLALVTMDDDFKIDKTKELDSFYDYNYDESGTINGYQFLSFKDLPKFKTLNDSTYILQILAEDINNDGVAYIKLNRDLEITDDKFIIKKGENYMRLPTVNSIEITDDAIIECKINNFYDQSAKYPTEIIISKYDLNLNLICESTINKGYYYPRYILATKDGGFLTVGSSHDINNYDKTFLYVTKVDENGILSLEEEDLADNQLFSFYPNPAKNIIHIDLSENTECKKVEVYSIDGRKCLEQNRDFETIDITNLDNGIYLIKAIFENGETYIDKLIVE